MTNNRRLSDALKHVAPDQAGKLKRAGREARDARRMDDPDVEEVLLARMAARLHRDERKDPNRALTKAQKAAQRAAKRTAQELTPDDSPSAEEVAKFAAYHEERTAQLEAPALNAEGDDEWDVKAESLARRERLAEMEAAGQLTSPLDGAAIVAQQIAQGKVPTVDLSGHRGARLAAAIGAVENSRDGGINAAKPTTMVKKVGHTSRLSRPTNDKPDCRPSPTRGNCGGNQR